MLQNKFEKKTSPIFFIEELNIDEIAERTLEARQKKYPTIEGSDSFQVMVFTPNSLSFRAAPHLCICDTCMHEYGSCSLFTPYQLKTVELKKIFLRSVNELICDSEDLGDGDSMSDDFLLPNTYCAVAPHKSSKESLWFIKVKDSRVANESVTDDYQHTVSGGQEYIEGQFLDKVDDMFDKGMIYKLILKKKHIFIKSQLSIPLYNSQQRIKRCTYSL